MRVPGEAWGPFALESAMDELAAKLGIDPLELRLRNHAEIDPNDDKPWSSKSFRACYRLGAERFGWHRPAHPGAAIDARRPRPRRVGHGDGHVPGRWPAAVIRDCPHALLRWHSGARAAHRHPGSRYRHVHDHDADRGRASRSARRSIACSSSSATPPCRTAPVEGGSFTAASVGSAVKAVCQEVCGKLFQLARTIDDSPLADAELADVTFTGGHIRSNRDSSRAVSLTEVLRQGTLDPLEAETSAGPSPERAHYSSYSHSAVFAEVKVDQDLGTIQVTRVVSAVAGGRILNPKTARSQVLGGIVWGIGMALEEESVIDHTFGRFVNHNLAEYHVPVNADVHDLEVIFVEEHDAIVNPLGAKGLGEPGVVGVAAAVANAVFHATGTRVRDLPITLDKLL